MKVVIQRVLSASVRVQGEKVGEIAAGLLVFLGIGENDTEEDASWLVNKILNLRVFRDSNGEMNQSLLDVRASLLLVSQFTLFASYKKGNRPSFIRAARPEKALTLYNFFLTLLQQELGERLQCGMFGKDMEIALLNDGPVTICMDTSNKE